MHYLITGHTGFKGSWLILLLHKLGHEISGISDQVPLGGLFETGQLHKLLTHDMRVDIRDSVGLKHAVEKIKPDVVIHFAAQSLVRESYKEPRKTYETNFNGTLNLLEATSNLDGIKAQLIITTDKVYRNDNLKTGYVESAPLGGDDPYSSSKAAADILTQAWIKSFGGPPTAIARAGNVIGGGDTNKDRLLVDLVDSYRSGKQPTIRFPNSIRPWQHVLDCLNGYLLLVEALLNGEGTGEWNFGPLAQSFVPVSELVEEASNSWGVSTGWTESTDQNPHEASILLLNSVKSEQILGWADKIPYPLSVQWTIRWFKKVDAGTDSKSVTLEQIENYLNLQTLT